VTFSNAFDGDPTWSPDGRKLAFESTRDGNSDIYVIGVDGSDETRLTTDRAFDADPAWSPDGTRIAFTSTRDGNKEIYGMNADGSNPRRLTNDGGAVANIDADAVDQDPAWSPDGRRIAFESNRDRNYEIYVVNADGSGLERLTNHPAQDALPAWSPDGTRIAFRSDRGGKENVDIWTMRPDGHGLVHVTHRSGLESLPSWQPLGPRPAGCTIWGTRGRDLIAGSPHRDRICGLGGNDTIVANDRRRDAVDGGAGRDVAFVDRRLDRVLHVERVVRLPRQVH
jgi:Tol biopolymer transport system component